MATAISHNLTAPSIPTTLQEANARIQQLESENRRLRHLINSREAQIAELEPGYYILTDQGDYNGPCPDMRQALRAVPDYTEDGGACTVIQVMRRYTAQPQAEEEDFGVEAGVDYPFTLGPAVANW